MIDVLNSNRRSLLVVATLAFFIGAVLFMLQDYYIYVLPSFLVLLLIVIFIEKIRKNIDLLIWGCLFLSIFLGSPRSIEEVSRGAVDPTRIVRIIVMSVIFLILILRAIYANFSGLRFSIKGPLGWFLVYAIVAMISATYSVQFFISLWKGFEIFVCVGAAMFLLQNLKSLKNIERFWSLNIFFIILLVSSSYLGAIFSPSDAFKEIRGVSFKVLEGIYPAINSNSLTQMAAILISIFIVRYFSYSDKSRPSYILYASLFLPALILSYGRTSILALFIALLVFLIISKKYLYLFLLGIIMLFTYIIDGYSYVQLFLEKGGSFSTLSGRLTTWPEALALFKESPIYGHGFYVASRIIFAEKVKVESLSTTDNTYLDVLLSVGIIGFIPFALMIYGFAKQLYKNWTFSMTIDTKRLKYEFLCVAIIIFFRSLTGPSIQILHWNLLIFLALIICSISLRRLESSINSQPS